jgi:hypothetical protein
MPTPVFRGKIEAGKICLDRRDEFAAVIASLDGKPVELILRRLRTKRSSNQNKYYWGVVIALFAEHCGYSAEEMHDALKWQLLQKHEQGVLPTVRSTADLSVDEFTEYVEQSRMLAAGMGVVIPGPEEVAA